MLCDPLVAEWQRATTPSPRHCHKQHHNHPDTVAITLYCCCWSFYSTSSCCRYYFFIYFCFIFVFGSLFYFHPSLWLAGGSVKPPPLPQYCLDGSSLHYHHPSPPLDQQLVIWHRSGGSEVRAWVVLAPSSSPTSQVKCHCHQQVWFVPRFVVYTEICLIHCWKMITLAFCSCNCGYFLGHFC